MKIFIGSSTDALPLAKKLASILLNYDHTPLLWSDGDIFVASKTTIESLEYTLNIVDAAIFVFNEDDKTWYKDNLLSVVRDNVLFEYGLFSGKLSRNKVCICCSGKPRIASDLAGITYIDMKNPYDAEERLKTWIKSAYEAYKASNQTFIKLIGRDDFVISKAIKNAKQDIFISGSSLASLTYAVDTLKDLEPFRNIRLLTMDYDDEEVVNQFCKMAGKGICYSDMKKQDNQFKELYENEKIYNNSHIEVRKINILMPVAYFAVDLGEHFNNISNNSYIKVQHYLHEKSGSQCPNYIIQSNNDLFSYYLEQIEILWSKSYKY